MIITVCCIVFFSIIYTYIQDREGGKTRERERDAPFSLQPRVLDEPGRLNNGKERSPGDLRIKHFRIQNKQCLQRLVV